MRAANARRIAHLRNLMGEDGSGALLITELTDVQYLCGFSGSNAALLVLPDEVLLATDGRYRLQAQVEAPGTTLVVTRQLVADLLTAAYERGIRKVGFDPAAMSVATWRRICTETTDVALEPSEVDVSGLRAVKDDEELASVREACAISVRAGLVRVRDIK